MYMTSYIRRFCVWARRCINVEAIGRCFALSVEAIGGFCVKFRSDHDGRRDHDATK